MSETHVDLNTVVQFNSKIQKFSQVIKQKKTFSFGEGFLFIFFS